MKAQKYKFLWWHKQIKAKSFFLDKAILDCLPKPASSKFLQIAEVAGTVAGSPEIA